MNVNGSSPTQLTTVQGTNGTPDWQPLPYPGYPRPLGCGAAARLARTGVRAVHRAEPHARAAALIRLLQWPRQDLAERHRRHAGRQRSAGALRRLRAHARRARGAGAAERHAGLDQHVDD